MKKFSKKGVLLFAGAMAVCAFALPAVSSAASWGVIGTEHTLTSANLGFTSTTAGGLTSQCSNSSFTVDVRSATVLTVTSASFTGCTATAPAIGNDCTVTVLETQFPRVITQLSPTDIIIHRLTHYIFHDMPARPNSCTSLKGATTLLTGAVTGGSWNGNGAGQHGFVYSNDSGLVGHPGNTPIAVRGTITDVQQTLTLLPFP